MLFFNLKRNRILTAPPTTTPNPLERYKITNSFGADGCIMAVESPVYRPLIAPKTANAPSTSSIPTTTTAVPSRGQSGSNNARPAPTTKGYFTSKFAKIRDHANGNFAYGNDCKKFINCFQYRPHLQLCTEGKLFNIITQTCEDAVKVNCQSIHIVLKPNLIV